jgi:hypothetical protein
MKSKTKILLIAFLGVCVILCIAIFVKKTEKKDSLEYSNNIKASIYLRNTTGDSLLLESLISKSELTVLLYIDSKCGTCQSVLEELKNNPEIVTKAQVLVVSVEDVESIKNLSKHFSKEIFFLQANPKDIYNVLGSLRTPQVFVVNIKKEVISRDVTISSLKSLK